MMRVLTLADDAYAIPLAVMVRSLLEAHDPSRELSITIVDAGIGAANRRKLEESWLPLGAAKRARWRFVSPRFPAMASAPSITLARLTLPEYFDEPAGRVLVLCSDTFVLADLAALEESDLRGATLGATIDPFIPTVSSTDGLPHWREMGLEGKAPYFNTGAMVIDLDRWQQERVTLRAQEYLSEQTKPGLVSDQEVLNALLVGRWERLDSRWQTHPRTWQALGIPVPPDPWIVHFSGRFRPWQYPATSAPDRLFYEVLDRTAWRGVRPPETLAARSLALYDSPLRRWLYPVEHRLLGWKKRLEA